MKQETLNNGQVLRTYDFTGLDEEVKKMFIKAALGSASKETGKPVEEIKHFREDGIFKIIDRNLSG
jgi:hypothetical protein